MFFLQFTHDNSDKGGMIMNKKYPRLFLCILVISFLISSNAYATDTWPKKNGSPRLTNFNDTTVSTDIFLKHQLILENIGNPILMLSKGHHLYSVSFKDNKVYSVSLDTKEVLWTFTPSTNEDVRKIALINGNIVAMTYNHTYMLKDEGTDKSILWEKNVGGNLLSFDDKNIYVANENTIYSLDIQTGNTNWSYQIPSGEGFHSPITRGENKVYFTTHHPQQMVTKLYALDKNSGIPLWTTVVDFYSQYPLLQGDKIFITTQKDIYAYNANSGVFLWKTTLDSTFSPQYDDVFSSNTSTLFTRTHEGYLYGINMADGKVTFKADFRDYMHGTFIPFSRGPILVTKNEVLLENNGKLKFFNSSSGESTRVISIPNIKMQPVLVTDYYLLATDNQKLYVYAPPSDNQYVDPNGDGKPEQLPYPGASEDEFIYIVQPGDTLWEIADKNNVTIKMIVNRNQLDPNGYLWVGQNLIISKPYKIHIVQSGDSLWKIALDYGTTIPAIIENNDIDPNKFLRVGQRLVIPKPAKIHTVQSGDSLWKIALEYGTSIALIVEKNNLDPSKYLYIGQQIIIP